MCCWLSDSSIEKEEGQRHGAFREYIESAIIFSFLNYLKNPKIIEWNYSCIWLVTQTRFSEFISPQKCENIVENFPDWLTFNLLVNSNSIFYRSQKPMDVSPCRKCYFLFPLAMGAMICFDAQFPICLKDKTSPCFSPIMEDKKFCAASSKK